MNLFGFFIIVSQLTNSFNLIVQYEVTTKDVDSRSTSYLKFFARKYYLIGERMFR